MPHYTTFTAVFFRFVPAIHIQISIKIASSSLRFIRILKSFQVINRILLAALIFQHPLNFHILQQTGYIKISQLSAHEKCRGSHYNLL